VNHPISKEDQASLAESAYRVCFDSRQSLYRDFTEVELQTIPYRSHLLMYPKALLSTVPAVDKSIVSQNIVNIKADTLYAFIPTAKDYWISAKGEK